MAIPSTCRFGFSVSTPPKRIRPANDQGRDYPCGQIASAALARLLRDKIITCEIKTRDRYGRPVAICYADDVDIGGALVDQGLAVAFRRYSDKYVANEERAREFDSAIGVTFSTPNPATDYKNGDAFIWEWAVGKKFDNGLQIGVADYAYQQLTGDSGSGARLGPFKGRVIAVGPHLVYNTVLMQRPVIFNFRNYQEFEAENRFEGNVTTFGATVKY